MSTIPLKTFRVKRSTRSPKSGPCSGCFLNQPFLPCSLIKIIRCVIFLACQLDSIFRCSSQLHWKGYLLPFDTLGEEWVEGEEEVTYLAFLAIECYAIVLEALLEHW